MLLQDLRYGMRAMRRTPGSTAVADYWPPNLSPGAARHAHRSDDGDAL
jgi:hypothetical protein